MSERGLTVEFRLPGRKKPGKEQPPVLTPGAVPRIARLLALAWKWELAVRRGEVKDYATIARRHGLTAARVTQVCNLTLLAPDLQLKILETSGSIDLAERRLRRVHAELRWGCQLES